MPDIDASKVQVVVQARSLSQQTIDANLAAIASWLDSLITQGESAVTNWGTLTAVQKDNAAKQTVQAVTRLARLVRGNLASPGA